MEETKRKAIMFAEAIVEECISMSEYWEQYECAFCDGYIGVDDESEKFKHDKDCIVLKAKMFLNDVEG